ncbi:MAG TPA: SRPBCC domain-containing protein [Acidimicrobiales bacterium]|nr:SRPBCC domain-containing protein [Acidimicrobiales bacterium]
MSADSTTRDVDLSVVVPGTPEEVWDAVATSAGITSWFVPSAVEGRVGGTVISDFGSFGKEEATVTAYDVPRRYTALLGTQPDDGRVVATEWSVEARDGDTCTVRLVHSGFRAGAEWDGEYQGTVEGWKLFLENLRLHLTFFKGERADAIVPVRTISGPNARAWAELCSALDVRADLAVGDHFETGPDAPLALRGAVHHAQRTAAVSAYLFVLEGPLRGTALVAAEGGGDAVMISTWLYLYEADAPAVERTLNELFAGFTTS